MRAWKIFTSLVCAATVAACASQPPAPSDYSAIEPPVGYEESVPRLFADVLKDPDSAHYRYAPPARAYVNNGLIHGGGYGWIGYAIPVLVNAKNSYGGYTGFREYIVLFRGDNPFMETGPNDPVFHWAQ